MVSWKEYEEILSHLTPEQRQAVLERDSELHKENLKTQDKIKSKQGEISLYALIPFAAIYAGFTAPSFIMFILYFIVLYLAFVLLFAFSSYAFERLLEDGWNGDKPSKAKYIFVLLSAVLISGLVGIVLAQKLGFPK